MNKFSYFGVWKDLNETSSFFVFIDKKFDLKYKTELMIGKIYDPYGVSDFFGIVKENEIAFFKQYYGEALEYGASDKPIEYMAINFGPAYVGNFVVDGTTLGAPGKWKGTFALVDLKKINDYL